GRFPLLGKKLFIKDVLSKDDAVVADVNAGAGDQLFDFSVGFSAETAQGQICRPRHTCADYWVQYRLIFFIRQARNFLSRLDHFVHQTIVFGLVGTHVIVAVAVPFHLFNWLARVMGNDGVQALLEPQHVFDPNLHIAGGAFRPAEDLMNHDIGIGEGVTFAFGPTAEEDGAHAGSL